jgi:hypothetical protein
VAPRRRPRSWPTGCSREADEHIEDADQAVHEADDLLES